MIVVPVKDSEKPGMVIFRTYFLFGIQKEFVYQEMKDGSVQQVGESFWILYPTRRKLIDRGRYKPHSNTRERERNKKNYANR